MVLTNDADLNTHCVFCGGPCQVRVTKHATRNDQPVKLARIFGVAILQSLAQVGCQAHGVTAQHTSSNAVIKGLVANEGTDDISM